MKMRDVLVGVSVGCVLSVAALGAQHHAGAAPATKGEAAATKGAKSAPTSDAAKIKSAASAAPAAVGKDATIVDMSADGTMRTLRQGSNNFTCMPDNATTPGPDPMCADRNAMAWLDAWAAKKEPPADKAGFMYMLGGGTDASNTDPYATKPEANNNWINTGPHIMVVGSKTLLEGYPRDAKPNTTAPYVMWPGTPYEHLMIPVK